MKYLICSLLVTLLLVPLVWSQTRAIHPVRIEATTAQDESISYIYEESHALIIGVSDYTNGWSKLAGVKEDVTEVQRALEDNGFEVEVVEDPTLDELEIAIEDFIFDKGADPENRLLIYYAGHGHTKTLGYGGEMGYLVPADAPLPKKGRDIAFQRSVMSMQEIEVYAKNTSAKHVLFMFDSCFAGSVFLATRAAPSYIEVFTEEPVRQFITSGSAEQEVPDISIFRRAFIDALEGSADFDKDGYLTGSELGTYIQKRTAEDWKGELTPQYGKLQDPNLNKGDFVFKIGKPANQSSATNTVTANSDLAAQAWEVVKDSTNPKILEEFIRMFPSAPQRNLAKLKLMTLESPSSVQSTEDQVMAQVLFGEAAKKKLLETKDCVGCDLRDMDMRGADLTEASLTGVILYKADLRYSDLGKANLSKADLRKANLWSADLRGANLREVDLSEAMLISADLRHADLSGANLTDAHKHNTYLTGAKLCNTTMPDGSIANRDCYATQADTNQRSEALSGEAAQKLFRDNECVGCDLNGTSLRGANLEGANLYGASLTKASLTKANLYGAYLTGANLVEANLREADLRGADLQEASLTGASLTKANLTGAYLRKANLRGASLTEASLSRVNLQQANLRGASLTEASLTEASLSRANLAGANLREANLREANLAGANLTGAKLSEAKFCRTTMPDGSTNNDDC